MGFIHLEAHLDAVAQGFARVAVEAERAKAAAKDSGPTSLSPSDVLQRLLQSSALTPQQRALYDQMANRGGFLSGYLEALIAGILDPDKTREISNKQKALVTERFLQQAFPGFSASQLESLIKRVLKENNDQQQQRRPASPSPTPIPGGNSGIGGVVFRISVKNNKPFIDVLNDSGGSDPFRSHEGHGDGLSGLTSTGQVGGG